MKAMLCGALVVVLSLVCLVAAQEAKPPAGQRQQVGAYMLSGPYVHNNLTIFLVHGKGALPGRQYLTLDEALASKKAVMHETGSVNELEVENLDPQLDLYISAGDIVKGGQQDRTIAQDLIVKAGSGRVPIGSFCVESGRWSRRGGEDVGAFSASNAALATKGQKIAARLDGDQGKVWEEVRKAQTELSENLGQSVQAAESSSSLQLTLENKAVVENTEGYTQALAPIVENQDDVIGYAFAINGEVNSVDIYANPELFHKLWPKLLKSTVVEAMATKSPTTQPAELKLADVEATMTSAEAAPAKARELNDRTRVLTNDSAEAVRFETRDEAAKEGEGYVRRNYIKK